MRRTSAVSLSLVLALVMFGTGPTATVASAQQDCALGERIASDGFTSTSIIDPTSNRWEDEWEMEPEFSDQIGATDVRLNGSRPRIPVGTSTTAPRRPGSIHLPSSESDHGLSLHVLRDLAWVQHHLGATGRCIPTNGCLPMLDPSARTMRIQRTSTRTASSRRMSSQGAIEFRRFDTWLTWDTYEM